MGLYGSPQVGSPQSYQPQARRSGWGRFWIGVLVGGCGLLLIEAFGTCAVFLIGGAAALHALPSPGFTTGQSQPCSPQPCLARNGLTLEVNAVNRNVGVGAPFGTPDPAFHRVILTVTFVDEAGDHEVSVFPYVYITDSSGQQRFSLTVAAGCDVPSGAHLTAGQKLGPLHLCFDVRGAPATTLTLTWEPYTTNESRLDLRL
jgi:hypothetical protein